MRSDSAYLIFFREYLNKQSQSLELSAGFCNVFLPLRDTVVQYFPEDEKQKVKERNRFFQLTAGGTFCDSS